MLSYPDTLTLDRLLPGECGDLGIGSFNLRLQPTLFRFRLLPFEVHLIPEMITLRAQSFDLGVVDVLATI